MLAPDEFVPEAPLGLVDRLNQLQPAHLIDAFRHVHRRGRGAAQTARAAAPVVVARRGQDDAAGRLERAQGLHAAGDLRLAAGFPEPEQLADPPANLGAAGRVSGF